ncbi:MAG: hypothetical protein DME21_01540, partial [Verrucomicrobia bacterium]
AHDTITISLWIFGDASEPQPTSVFYGSSASDGSGIRSLNVHLPWSDSVIYWDTAGCCDPSLHRVMIGEPDSTKWKGRWNHYAFVKDGGAKEIWQNGSRILQGINTAALTPVRSFFIGAFGFGNSLVYHGLIDDFAVWDHALTPAQIQALASGATPLEIDKLDPLISTDLGAMMRYRNASAYVRAPFVLAGPADRPASAAHELQRRLRLLAQRRGSLPPQRARLAWLQLRRSCRADEGQRPPNRGD